MNSWVIKLDGLDEPMPVNLRGAAGVPKITDPWASTPMMVVDRLTSRKNRATPARVPPVDTARKSAFTRPCI